MVVTPALCSLLVVDPCDDCHGLLRLQPFHLDRPEAVKELISRSGTEWIAVLARSWLPEPASTIPTPCQVLRGNQLRGDSRAPDPVRTVPCA